MYFPLRNPIHPMKLLSTSLKKFAIDLVADRLQVAPNQYGGCQQRSVHVLAASARIGRHRRVRVVNRKKVHLLARGGENNAIPVGIGVCAVQPVIFEANPSNKNPQLA